MINTQQNTKQYLEGSGIDIYNRLNRKPVFSLGNSSCLILRKTGNKVKHKYKFTSSHIFKLDCL